MLKVLNGAMPGANTPNEKAAPVRQTPEAARETTCTPIFFELQPDDKEYRTAQAQLALKGWQLSRAYVVGRDGVTYVVRNWEGSRNFAAWHSVVGFMASLEGWSI